ncbi:hypothetical protein BS78_03G069100 [Paspalum vaginatum]|nr:hypothetical protein BS78_03G069100 [Paspalum vaginatum]
MPLCAKEFSDRQQETIEERRHNSHASAKLETGKMEEQQETEHTDKEEAAAQPRAHFQDSDLRLEDPKASESATSVLLVSRPFCSTKRVSARARSPIPPAPPPPRQFQCSTATARQAAATPVSIGVDHSRWRGEDDDPAPACAAKLCVVPDHHCSPVFGLVGSGDWGKCQAAIKRKEKPFGSGLAPEFLVAELDWVFG